MYDVFVRQQHTDRHAEAEQRPRDRAVGARALAAGRVPAARRAVRAAQRARARRALRAAQGGARRRAAAG